MLNTPSVHSIEPRLELSLNQWLSVYPDCLNVGDAFVPLSHLLSIHHAATRSMQQVQSTFLKRPFTKRPYIIGVSGSVAAGKSHFSRALSMALEKWSSRPSIQLVTTDSFLFSLATLQREGLAGRKGFPESYNRPLMFDFLRSISRGRSQTIPIYSHATYDIIPGEHHHVQVSDIVILEGVNVCQVDSNSRENILDYVDFSIYLHASEEHLRSWYVERFLRLKAEAALESGSYFSRFHNLSSDEALEVALERWERINLVNLQENIFPSRDNADLIIEKSANHAIEFLKLRVV